MKNPFFVFFASLVLVLTIASLIIFGFDINTPNPRRKRLGNMIQNKSTTAHFYKINDTFAFGVFLDRERGEMDVTLTTYERNIAPYCFVCGWYASTPDDNRFIIQPYLANEYVYSREITDEPWGGALPNQYAFFNLKTGEFSSTKNLNTLPNFPADSGKIITREYVSDNYDEISFFGADDEDCMIMWSALFVCYIVLLIWGFIILLKRFTRNKVV